MKQVSKKCGSMLAEMARKVTTTSANTACPFLTYQPRLPESAKKLRKF